MNDVYNLGQLEKDLFSALSELTAARTRVEQLTSRIKVLQQKIDERVTELKKEAGLE